MAERFDIAVDWDQSPRVIRVASPSTDLTVQDLVDTSRAIEDDISNMDDDFLISAAGKEQLGGGVRVGVTATLNNAQVQFEERLTSVSSGTATAVDTVQLTDSAATFVTDGVQPGATIVNLTDGSACTVSRVFSETVLFHSALQDGTNNAWAVPDSYKVWNTIQCEISGGNVVATDLFGLDTSPVLPSAFTQVVRTSSSSATLQEIAAIEFGSYEGAVTVDVASSNTGTTFPVGTLQAPVNNMGDALSIAQARGLSNFRLLSDLTITGVDASSYRFVGAVPNVSVVVDVSANVSGTVFDRVSITGTFDSDSEFVDCVVTDVSMLDGALFRRCQMHGTISATGSSLITMFECYDGTPPPGDLFLDLTGHTGTVSIREWSGGIELINKTSSSSVAVDLVGGEVRLASSITSGTFYLGGVGNLTDSSTGTTIFRDNLLSLTAIGDAIRDTPLPTAPVADSLAETLLALRAVSAKGEVVYDNFVYDSNGFLTSMRLRAFPTSALAAAATNGGTGEGEILETVITGTPDPTQLVKPRFVRAVET